MSLLQVIDFMEFQEKLSDIGKKLYKEMRAIVPKIVNDVPLYPHIENMRQYLVNNRPNLIN